MMTLNTARIATPDGGGARAFALGTCSFGAPQGVRAHTVA